MASTSDVPIDVAREQILRRDIPWEAYMTAKLISGTGLQLLRRFDHKTREVQSALIEEDGAAYFNTFLTVLVNVNKEDTVDYTLAIIHDLLSANPKRARLFHSPAVAAEHSDVYSPFLKLLSEKSAFSQEASCRILTLILSERPKASQRPSPSAASSSSSAAVADSAPITPTLEAFVQWLASQLTLVSSSSRKAAWLLHSLSIVLREADARPMLVAADGVKLLVPFIAPATSQQNMQLLYDAVLSSWLLSFSESAVDALKAAKAAPALIEVARFSSKEKIVRVTVMTLNNLLLKGHLGPQLVELGLPKVVQSLKQQAWHDEELKDVLVSLEDSLRHNLKVLSSFDKYKQEILSGSLDWSPMHKDPAFWRENVARFEDNDFQVLRVLVTLLDTSKENRTLAVACQDLGQFIQSHPSGRNIAVDFRAKEKVIPLMESPDPEVRKQALLCVQKLLLSARYVSFLQ